MIIFSDMNKNLLTHTALKEIGFTLLAEGKTLKIKADGFSMYPAIKPGSVIYIEPCKAGSEPAAGDIIAWKRESGFVVHRLVSIIKKNDNLLFVTRGDSSIAEDEPVDADQIAGRVVKIEYPEGNPALIVRDNKKTPDYKLNRFRVRVILKVRRLQRIFS